MTNKKQRPPIKLTNFGNSLSTINSENTILNLKKNLTKKNPFKMTNFNNSNTSRGDYNLSKIPKTQTHKTSIKSLEEGKTLKNELNVEIIGY